MMGNDIQDSDVVVAIPGCDTCRDRGVALGKGKAGLRRSGGMAATAIAQDLRKVSVGGGHPLCAQPHAKSPRVSRERQAGTGQQYLRAFNQTCNSRSQELPLHGIKGRRRCCCRRIHAHRNLPHEQGRSGSMAMLGSRPCRGPQDDPPRRTHAVELDGRISQHQSDRMDTQEGGGGAPLTLNQESLTEAERDRN